MVTDIRGLELTGLDDNGVIQYEAMVQASYEYQPNIGKFIIPIIETYPDAPMPKVMQAYSVASEGRYTSLITVAQIAKDVRRVYNTATARERRHIDAITALSTGKIKQAIEIWDNILADWPLDLVAFRQMSLNLLLLKVTVCND